MRVSKAPEERRREMIDTAMRIFAKKGYEATSMTDIAKEMHVVSGLCYRYFSSKEELYQIALLMYAKECVAPIIAIMEADYESAEDYIERLQENFHCSDGKERYHEFFHGEGNEMFHDQLVHIMLRELTPHCVNMLKRMKEKGFIHIEDCETTAAFIMYGQMPIICDESLETKEKSQRVLAIIKKILSWESEED